MAVEVILPRVDMDMTTGKITKWFANEGDAVTKGQALFEIESDKAAMEVEAPAAGVLRGVTGRPGDELPVATVVGWIVAPGEAFEQKSPVPPRRRGFGRSPAKAAGGRTRRREPRGGRPRRRKPKAACAPRRKPGVSGASLAWRCSKFRAAAPAAASRARTSRPPPPGAARPPRAHAPASALGERAGRSRGAAPCGRAWGRDRGSQGHRREGSRHQGRRQDRLPRRRRCSGGRRRAIPDVPTVDFEKFGPVEVTPLSRIKRISGPRLHASWLNIPHVTHCDEADITDLEAFRRSLDEAGKADKAAPYRVSLLPLVIKCSVAALKAFPLFNSALAPGKDALVTRNYWNIGVAIDTADGLVVAVVRDADRKGVTEIARELGALSAKARDGKLTPAEMQGATFTISSLGGIGGTAFTPIINAPEVAILGVVRASMAPVWDGAAFQPRLMLPLCLSYDHRVIDGAAAARFTRRLADFLTDIRRTLL